MAAIDTALAAARTVLFRRGVSQPEDSPEYQLYAEIMLHKSQTDSEAAQRAELYRRMDDLYYPGVVTKGGADHFIDDPRLKTDGNVHVSLNNPPPYVDIPADLQAMTPYINAVPDSAEKKDQEDADRREKMFWMFWDVCNMDLNLSVMSRIRSLYGAVAVKPYWDKDLKLPALTVIESPANLRIGWGASDFSRKDWALYCYSLSPQAVKEEWDLDVTTEVTPSGTTLMLVGSGTTDDPLNRKNTINIRNPSTYETLQVLVYDYWYKKDGKIWNAIYVENHQVVDTAHPEYDDVPYVFIPNGKIPGRPEGRPALYDVEQIFREYDERFSDYGQLIHKTLTKQQFQIVGGDDAPSELTKSMMPGEDRPAIMPPGCRLEAVVPHIPTFDFGAYVNKLDQKLAERTGMSDLILGLAGSRLVGSSKAINAELAMFVPRIALDREYLYVGIKELWAVVGKLWSRKDPKVGKILGDNFRIDIQPPEITPRDDVEQAQRVSMLLQNGVISLRTAMDWVGILNPSEEQDASRQENTDAALQPAKVMTLMQLMSLAQQLGYTNTQQAASQGPAQVNVPAGGPPPPGGSNAANQPGVTGTAENTPENAMAPNGAPAQLLSQTMLQGGKTTGRVLAQQKIGG
jgi:hypothetical protein